MEQTSKKWPWVLLGIFFVFLILGGLWWFFGRGTEVGTTIAQLFPFGAPTNDVATGNNGNSQGGIIDREERMNADDGVAMFRQLANVPVAGAYAITKNNVQYVRYIEKETGHITDVSLVDGSPQKLTNTTIPRTLFADWAEGGNTVILRSLEQDVLSGTEVIKTHIGRLKLPTLSATSSLPASDVMGTLAVELLPDNIIALSVAQNGKSLFFLLKTPDGVSGSILNLGTKALREVFRNTFSEWLPQLLNDDTIILTTKPSGNVPGYSYRYDQKTKALERLVRERNGLTTMGTGSGSRVLYGENIGQTPTMGVYSKSGLSGDEGIVLHERTLGLGTLPEKCAWLADEITVLCGSFTTTPTVLIPDSWYQGVISFADTFWSVNTNTGNVTFLADPAQEKATTQEFDVVAPLLSRDGKYFVFINKKDGTLWSMRIPEEQLSVDPLNTSALSPAEREDAAGSLPANTSATAPIKK